MFTLRCTQKLLKRMPLNVEDLKDAATSETTTALGDWYAHLLLLQRQHLVMLVSDRSRLCILTTARDPERLEERFRYALIDLLRALDIPEDAIARERREMNQMGYGLTTGTPTGRSVLGSINDYTNALRYSDLAERTLSDWNVTFSDWMCGPLGYKHPQEVARQLLKDALVQNSNS
jgi:hypothetical protein